MDLEEIFQIIDEKICSKNNQEKKEIISELIYKLQVYYCKPYFIKSSL
jgi:hypothetical protein